MSVEPPSGFQVVASVPLVTITLKHTSMHTSQAIDIEEHIPSNIAEEQNGLQTFRDSPSEPIKPEFLRRTKCLTIRQS